MVDPVWRTLQIADSAFPTGGFAHSAGLEAAAVAGVVRGAEDLDAFVYAHVWTVGNGSLPFVAAAHRDPAGVWAIDALAEAHLTNHVANRASRTQGRTFAATSAHVFDAPVVRAIADRAATREVPAHLGPVFGAVLASVGVGLRDALGLHLLLALRSVTSAAVRLGIVGPHEAQRVQGRHAATLDSVLAACEALTPAQAAVTSPLFDLFGATHDRLYARLFQS
jgi:urease accessory protein